MSYTQTSEEYKLLHEKKKKKHRKRYWCFPVWKEAEEANSGQELEAWALDWLICIQKT